MLITNLAANTSSEFTQTSALNGRTKTTDDHFGQLLENLSRGGTVGNEEVVDSVSRRNDMISGGDQSGLPQRLGLPIAGSPEANAARANLKRVYQTRASQRNIHTQVEDVPTQAACLPPADVDHYSKEPEQSEIRTFQPSFSSPQSVGLLTEQFEPESLPSLKEIVSLARKPIPEPVVRRPHQRTRVEGMGEDASTGSMLHKLQHSQIAELSSETIPDARTLLSGVKVGIPPAGSFTHVALAALEMGIRVQAFIEQRLDQELSDELRTRMEQMIREYGINSSEIIVIQKRHGEPNTWKMK